MIRILLPLAGLLLAAPSPEQDTSYRDKSLTPAERTACVQKGGTVERAGILQNERCTMRRPIV